MRLRGPAWRKTAPLHPSERRLHERLLANGPMTTAALAALLQLSRSRIEQNIAALLDAGAVRMVGLAPALRQGTAAPRLWQALPIAPAAGPRKRPCLGCGGNFLSSGAGHRLCDPCRKSAAELPAQYVGAGA